MFSLALSLMEGFGFVSCTVKVEVLELVECTLLIDMRGVILLSV